MALIQSLMVQRISFYYIKDNPNISSNKHRTSSSSVFFSLFFNVYNIVFEHALSANVSLNLGVLNLVSVKTNRVLTLKKKVTHIRKSRGRKILQSLILIGQ